MTALHLTQRERAVLNKLIPTAADFERWTGGHRTDGPTPGAGWPCMETTPYERVFRLTWDGSLSVHVAVADCPESEWWDTPAQTICMHDTGDRLAFDKLAGRKLLERRTERDPEEEWEASWYLSRAGWVALELAWMADEMASAEAANRAYYHAEIARERAELEARGPYQGLCRSCGQQGTIIIDECTYCRDARRQAELVDKTESA